MPILEDIVVTTPSNSEYSPKPADMYQVQIVDIDKKETKKYKSEEPDTQFFFKFAVLDEGEYRATFIFTFSSMKWFSGGKSYQPSKLFEIFKSVYSYYYPKVNLMEWETDMINKDTINDLIGKQLRVTTAVTATGKEKVNTFMPIKQELTPYVAGEEEGLKAVEAAITEEGKKK